MHQATLADGKLTVDGDFFIGYNLGDIDKKAKFEKYTLITEVDGKEIAKKDITDIIAKHGVFCVCVSGNQAIYILHIIGFGTLSRIHRISVFIHFCFIQSDLNITYCEGVLNGVGCGCQECHSSENGGYYE